MRKLRTGMLGGNYDRFSGVSCVEGDFGAGKSALGVALALNAMKRYDDLKLYTNLSLNLDAIAHEYGDEVISRIHMVRDFTNYNAAGREMSAAETQACLDNTPVCPACGDRHFNVLLDPEVTNAWFLVDEAHRFFPTVALPPALEDVINTIRHRTVSLVLMTPNFESLNAKLRRKVGIRYKAVNGLKTPLMVLGMIPLPLPFRYIKVFQGQSTKPVSSSIWRKDDAAHRFYHSYGGTFGYESPDADTKTYDEERKKGARAFVYAVAMLCLWGVAIGLVGRYLLGMFKGDDSGSGGSDGDVALSDGVVSASPPPFFSVGGEGPSGVPIRGGELIGADGDAHLVEYNGSRWRVVNGFGVPLSRSNTDQTLWRFLDL